MLASRIWAQSKVTEHVRELLGGATAVAVGNKVHHNLIKLSTAPQATMWRTTS